jgi:hypothetical protein
MVKKREAFRPFAPSVLEECLHKYFDAPRQVTSLPFMAFVVPVRPEYRELLRAITHVDGTARVQTVSKTENIRYYELLSAFERYTGVPILLNTSFNNDAEPIVDNLSDAMNCFLSTDLDLLVVGNTTCRKRYALRESMKHLVPVLLPRYALLSNQLDGVPANWIYDVYFMKYIHISNRTFRVLEACIQEKKPFGAALEGDVVHELIALWRRRVFRCTRDGFTKG